MNSKYHCIDIIEKAYITDIAILYANPNVKFVLEAPYDYVVYEFADELSEFLRKEEKKVDMSYVEILVFDKSYRKYTMKKDFY